MSGQTMTTHQVADLCEVDEKTIRRWIAKASDKMSGLSDKLSEAEATKKPAHWHLNEVLAIINAGGKHTMAALLAENAKGAVLTARQTTRLPAGAQLRELRLMAEKRILSAYQVQQVLGVAAPPAALPAPERPATDAEIEEGFTALRTLIANQRQAIPPGAVDRVVRAAAGATRKTMEAILDHEKAASRQPTLGGLS